MPASSTRRTFASSISSPAGNHAYSEAKQILSGNMNLLHTMAKTLLERETLNREEVELVVAGKELPPQESVVAPDKAPPQLPGGEARPSGAGPVLGTPPPKPAGA